MSEAKQYDAAHIGQLLAAGTMVERRSKVQYFA